MRLAVIADVHGNLPALEAVLADVATRRADRVINLGDCASGPLWPRECVEVLARADMATVRGNHDRWVGTSGEGGGEERPLGASDRYAAAQLDAAQRAWLAALPPLAWIDAGPGLLAFHGRPADDNRYLLEDVSDGRLVRASADDIRRRLGGTAAPVVLCGHSHLPGLVRLDGTTLIVNPGSVGCPAYDDPDAPAHMSEAGSPHARYALLAWSGEGVCVEHIALEYAWGDAARRAERNDRRDWAAALRTGFMPPLRGRAAA
jgi:predicted phosphodiesterase